MKTPHSPLAWLLLALLLPLRLPAQSTGGLDATFQFSPGATPIPASSYALAPNGKVVVAGQFTSYHGTARKGLARLNADGTVDTGFDPKTGAGDLVVGTFRVPGSVSQVAALPDGRLLVSGAFSTWDGFATKYVARLKSDGSVDTTFSSSLVGTGSLLPLPDDRVLVHGKAGDLGTGKKIGLVRLDANGAVDTSFADAGLGAFAGLDFDAVTISALVRQADGKLVVAFAGLKGGGPAYGIGRLQPDGALDTTFKPGLTSGFTSSLTGLGVDDTGRVVVTGTTPTYGGKTVGKVFRLTPSGDVDSSFTYAVPTTLATGVHVFGDGTSLVTGTFTGITGPIIRLQGDGSRDTTYGFTQTGSFGILFLLIANQPKVNADGQTFVLASSILIQNGTQFLQANGPIRVTGSNGGGPIDPPKITTQPAPVTVGVGGTASFTVVASGPAPLSYQWKRGTAPISGATSPTYTIASVSESDADDYSVSVSNFGGTVTSQPATLTVTRPPRITGLPPSPFLVAQGVAASLVVVADGPGTFQYQWFKDGNAIPGALAATLDLANPQAGDAGHYEVEVKNPYGSVRSTVIDVVFAPSAPSWFVASATDGPGQITDLWRDSVRGVVVTGTYGPAAAGAPEFTFGGVTFPRPAVLNGFVGRIDDTGTTVWMLPIVADLSNSLRVATYVAAAADGQGNIFVAGPIRGLGKLATLNLGAPGFEGTFLAKLDASGKGLWAEFIEGNLYERQLATDPEGNVILTGRFTSDLNVRSHRLSAIAFGGAAVFKFNADGSVRWANSYQKADTVGGAVDIYNVTADATGIYLAGTYNQSIRFGEFTEKLLAPPYRALGWLGKLDPNGAPQWLKAIGGSLPTDIALSSQGMVWIVGQDDPPGGQVLHGWRTNGTFVSRAVVARSGAGGTSTLARGVGVDSAQRPLLGGHAQGIATVGTFSLGIGANPQSLWAAAAGPAGAVTTDAHLAGYLAVPPAGSLFVDEFEASPAAELYYAGSWTGVLYVNGRPNTNASHKVFVAKTAAIPFPAVPSIVNHPSPGLFAVGENRTLSCTAKGGNLAFRWLKNGQPIQENNIQVALYPGIRPGETSSVITFIGLTEANAGDYTCEVSNGLGTTLSNAARFEAGSRPAIVTQPAPQRANAGQTLTLSVSATGGNLTYEWYRNGAPIAGGPNSPTLSIPAAAITDAAAYTVLVSNGLGSIMSDRARVIVCSGEAEATFLGRPWVRVLDDTQTLPGTTTSIGAWARDDRPRFTLHNRTIHAVATAGSSGNALAPGQRALLRWRANTLETLVWTNHTTPDGDRFIDCFYPTDETDGAMNFTAFSTDTSGRPRAGLYELRAGVLTRRVDDRTPLPTGVGQFLTFGSNVRRGGTMIGYPGTLGDPTGAGSGIFAVTATAVSQLVKGNATLPSPAVTRLGGLPSNFGLSFDGTHVVFAVSDASAPLPQAVFLSDLSGNVTRVTQTGDAIPGRAGQTFASFGATDIAGGAAYFAATSSSRAPLLVRAKDATLTVLGSASLLAAAGPDQVYADGGAGLVSRYSGSSDQPELVLPIDAVIDCRHVKSVWQIDAQGDDVVVGVDFTDGTAGIFACLSNGPVDPPPTLRIDPPTLVGNRLRFTLPTRAGKSYRVEATSALGASSWTTQLSLPGDGTAKPVDLPANDAARFFRVVEE